MSTFAIGDIHGNLIGLRQCIERCQFNYDNDTLIQLGDVIDGGEYVYECIEELLGCDGRIT
jgi:serine/threonine protein phosphatase 1